VFQLLEKGIDQLGASRCAHQLGRHLPIETYCGLAHPLPSGLFEAEDAGSLS
jgi:hypothetical protein